MTGDRKPWGRAATLGLALAALLIGQLVALTVLAWRSGFGPGDWTRFAHDGTAVSLSLCISTPIQIMLLAYFARQRCANAADYLGLSLPRVRDALYGTIAVVVFAVLSDGISILLGRQVVTEFQFEIYRTSDSAGLLSLLWLTVVLVAPIGEETLFRGFLFRGWHRSPHNAWGTITATALLWSSIHLQYDLYTIVQVFLCGLLFGWFRWASGSTILTMLMHGLINCEGMLQTFAALRC